MNYYKQFKSLVGAAVLAASATCLAAPAHAEWPDHNLSLIIPASPGGGFDTYARVLGKAMSDQLGVQVLPENVSGAAGQRGATAAYTARPDGYTFAIFNVPGIIEPLITGTKVRYDVDKIDWLGALAFEQYIVVVSKDSPFNSVEDLKKAKGPITFAAYGSSGAAANRILCSELGIECQIITGYPGNNDALLGVVRGDAVASVTPITTATSFNTGGDLKGILLMSQSDAAAFPDVPKADKAGYPALASLGLIRAFGLPPGVPHDVRFSVEMAFDKAMHDEQIKSWAASTNSPYFPMSGAQLKGLIQQQTDLLMKYKDIIATAK
ncbi:Bug family tripartite tricarboxylate transporter substrate binding protein [Rhizobium halophytocola]|uniref:Tripartite-type tricarboxylate transporter receptor subunit TctC n=1 Tax=Rhizobium halophytocola TaxID=735519 RepID=A0ABS4DUQ4_9HYPH|nr:tripartite tricarboxylate transporter substrate-binding protein [Rhizobium halophytocola]MBP1849410.1 tripartite-type tricarboxylate transporter receptor subunit TctC [Rhizobium halophytocola]